MHCTARCAANEKDDDDASKWASGAVGDGTVDDERGGWSGEEEEVAAITPAAGAEPALGANGAGSVPVVAARPVSFDLLFF